MASKIQVDKISRNSGTPEFTVPTADGIAGQFLKTDGSGVLSFDTVTTNPLTLTGSTNNTIATVTGANALAGEANLTYDGNTLDIKNAGTASSINLYCESSNAHYTKIKSGPHSGATAYTLTLPNAPPSANGQVLSATTAGVASWATAVSNTPMWYAYANSDQTGVTDATWTKCTNLGGETIDSDGAYDTGTQTFTVPAGKAGKYYIYGSQVIGSGAVSTMYAVGASIYVDGVKTVEFYMGIQNAAGFKMGVEVSGILDLAVGEAVTLYGYGDMTTGTPAFYSSGFTQAGKFFGWRLSA